MLHRSNVKIIGQILMPAESANLILGHVLKVR